MSEPKTAQPRAIPVKEELPFSCEQIAYWFFRLNGCFFLENFLVHHERRGREGTEIDMLAVRFPYRTELLLSGNSMPDHSIFNGEEKINIILAESKKGLCSINKSWLDPTRKNIERILHIVGAIPPGDISRVANKVYKNHIYDEGQYRLRMVALGDKGNTVLDDNIVQVIWPDVLLFIHQRFSAYRRYKMQHHQWNPTGKHLFKLVLANLNKPENFIEQVLSNLRN